MNVVQIPNSSRCSPDRQNPVMQTNCAVGMAETIRQRMRYRYQALPRSFSAVRFVCGTPRKQSVSHRARLHIKRFDERKLSIAAKQYSSL
jgi:hypothetical protein